MISAYIDQIPTQSLAGVLARGRDRCEGAPVARLHTLGFVNTSWIMPWLGLSLEQLPQDADLHELVNVVRHGQINKLVVHAALAAPRLAVTQTIAHARDARRLLSFRARL